MRKRMLVAFGIVPLLFAACGGDDDAATPSDDGVIEITMKDNTFEPDAIEVASGETVTFEFRNEGDVEHEAFVGTEAEQEAHEADMSGESEGGDAGHGGDVMDDPGTSAEEMPDEDHESSSAVSVAPGDSASFEHTFDEAGTILIGCHEPGHYEDGMKITVTVA